MENKNEKDKEEIIETIEVPLSNIATNYSIDNFVNAVLSKQITKNTHRAEYVFIDLHHYESDINPALIQQEIMTVPQIKYILVYEK